MNFWVYVYIYVYVVAIYYMCIFLLYMRILLLYTRTDPGSFNLTDISYRLCFSFVSFACIVRSFFVFRSFAFRACNLFIPFVYRSFRVSFAILIRRTHETKYERTNDTRYSKRNKVLQFQFYYY